MTAVTNTPIKPFDPQGIADTLLLTKTRAAKYIGISVASLDRLRERDEKFPFPVDICGPTKLFWRRTDIERYVAKLPPLCVAGG